MDLVFRKQHFYCHTISEYEFNGLTHLYFIFGLSFIGRPFSEQKLIELAYSFEQLTQLGSKGKPLTLPKHDLVDTVGVTWLLRKMLPSFEL